MSLGPGSVNGVWDINNCLFNEKFSKWPFPCWGLWDSENLHSVLFLLSEYSLLVIFPLSNSLGHHVAMNYEGENIACMLGDGGQTSGTLEAPNKISHTEKNWTTKLRMHLEYPAHSHKKRLWKGDRHVVCFVHSTCMHFEHNVSL